MREQIIKRIEDEKLIAIARGMGGDRILPLADALCKGGFGLIEITFNQSAPAEWAATAKAVEAVNKRFGGQMRAGAGTVLTAEQLRMAADAGAGFVLSPNTDAEVIKAAVKAGLVSIPGAYTASECAAARGAGADFVKLFPAGNLGAEYLKALRAPLSHIKFLCVGGITERNIPAFLEAGAAGFGIGGGLVNRDWIESGQYGKITELAEKYVAAARP
jgi:2-dehydro-3-deoxyphosphogluconate aldolase/(4S)-4-hydroxy-2-oxoglutarate aldolase